MISIQRTACPNTLADAPTTGDYYNKTAVVEALWDMQHGKCCYCERFLPLKGHLKAVEHFAPKSAFKGLRNDWSNLLLACSQCNGKKSAKFPISLSDSDNEDAVLYTKDGQTVEAAIIDPSRIDPEGHIDYEFSVDRQDECFCAIKARNGSELGTETITVVGLDEKYYSKLQWDFWWNILANFHLNLLKAFRDQDALAITAQRDKFEILMAPKSQFAGMARAFARSRRLDRDPVRLNIPQ